MNTKLWALLLLLTVNSYGQSRHLPVDPDHSGVRAIEPPFTPWTTLAPAQPLNPGTYAPPVDPGSVSVDELRLPAKAVQELEKSVKAYHAGDVRGSAMHLEKVLVIDPQYTPAHNALGRLYVSLHELDRAVLEFEKATAAEPRSASAMHNLTATLFLLKKYPEAETAARATLALDPLRNSTRYILGCTLVAEEHFNSETEELLRQSSKQFPNARLVLARSLMKRGAVEEATAELHAYLQVPDAPGKDEVQHWLEFLKQNSAQVSPSGKSE
jgi:Tfp pilus assembly protein PilF